MPISRCEGYNTDTLPRPVIDIKLVNNVCIIVGAILLSSSSVKAFEPQLSRDESPYVYDSMHPLSPLNPAYGQKIETKRLLPEQERGLIAFFSAFGLLALGTGIYYFVSDRKNK